MRGTGGLPFQTQLGLALKILTSKKQTSLTVLKKPSEPHQRMAQKNIFQIFVFSTLFTAQPDWHKSHCFCWGRDGAISRGTCEKQSSRKEHPHLSGNSFLPSTSQSSQHMWCHWYLPIPIQAARVRRCGVARRGEGSLAAHFGPSGCDSSFQQ